MATINTTQAIGIFTQDVADVFVQKPEIKGFGRSFFKTVEKSTLYVSTEIERHNEKIAFNVIKGQGANRNVFGKSTEHIYEPPAYHEDMAMNEMDFYDVLFGSKNSTISVNNYNEFVDQASSRLAIMRNRIERSYEKQAWGAMLDGLVPVLGGDTIDYRRKNTSKIDKGNGQYWVTNTVDPLKDIAEWCAYLRANGKVQGGEFNLILGSTAKDHLMNNDIFKERAEIRRFELTDMRMPQQNSLGGVTHGRFSAGDYIINVWTYPEIYQDQNGDFVKYMDDKKALLLPVSPNFTHAFSAVPMLMTDKSRAEMSQYISNVQGQYVLSNYVDQARTAHIFEIKSAGLCITTAVDQAFTAQVVA